MPWPVRCRRECCQARQRLARRPEEYAHSAACVARQEEANKNGKPPRKCNCIPKCKRCGKGELRVDGWRLKHERKKKPCWCYGYSFPHRKGSKWCDHNPKLTSEMMEQREAYA